MREGRRGEKDIQMRDEVEQEKRLPMHWIAENAMLNHV